MEKLIPKTFLPTLVLFNYGIIYECLRLRKYSGNFPKVKLNCKKAVNTSRFRFRCTAFVLGGKRKRKSEDQKLLRRFILLQDCYYCAIFILTALRETTAFCLWNADLFSQKSLDVKAVTPNHGECVNKSRKFCVVLT